ncbi:MAG TPA: VCBS repeat-containing protein, partial [Tepidisphaeraceae bacterium]
MPPYRFEHQFIDTSLTGIDWAQTGAADLDRDGRPEFVIGQKLGSIYWYDWLNGAWTRHLLGETSPSDVGGAALDVDGDGWIDWIAGGVWYRNSRSPGRPFDR